MDSKKPTKSTKPTATSSTKTTRPAASKSTKPATSTTTKTPKPSTNTSSKSTKPTASPSTKTTKPTTSTPTKPTKPTTSTPTKSTKPTTSAPTKSTKPTTSTPTKPTKPTTTATKPAKPTTSTPTRPTKPVSKTTASRPSKPPTSTLKSRSQPPAPAKGKAGSQKPKKVEPVKQGPEPEKPKEEEEKVVTENSETDVKTNEDVTETPTETQEVDQSTDTTSEEPTDKSAENSTESENHTDLEEQIEQENPTEPENPTDQENPTETGTLTENPADVTSVGEQKEKPKRMSSGKAKGRSRFEARFQSIVSLKALSGPSNRGPHSNLDDVEYSLEDASRAKPSNPDEMWSVVSKSSSHDLIDVKPSKSRKGWKTIRLFVSSTFKDFHNEREVLVKQVFPDLRLWCESRKLRLVECDLRWGVPKDTTSEDTIKICLSELDRCYEDNTAPFFLNLAGDRAGWIPKFEDVSLNLAAQYGWVYGLSVTEMEIVHGALRKLNPNALFMIRKANGTDGLPAELKKDIFTDEPYLLEKLTKLKTVITDSFPVTLRICSWFGGTDN